MAATAELLREVGKATRFTKERQPKNRGRKPRFFNEAKRAYQIDESELKDIMMWLLCLTKDELEAKMKDPDTPIVIHSFAYALHKDIGRGVTFTIKEILERLYGKADQKIDFTSMGESLAPKTIEVEIIDSRDKVDKEALEGK